MAIVRLTKTIIPQLVDAGAISRAGDMGRSIAKVGQEISQYAIKEQQAQDSTWVNEQIIKSKKYKISKSEELKQQQMTNPTGFADNSDKVFNEFDNTVGQEAPSERAKKLYLEQMSQQNLGYFQSHKNWESSQKVNNFDASVKTSLKDLGDLAYIAGKEGKPIDDLMGDAQNTLVAGSTFYSDQALEGLSYEMQQEMESKRLDGMIDTNPEKALKELKSGIYNDGSFDFESSMDVVEENEGGFVASDGASGAPAIYGINRKWHQEAFDQAKAITETKGEQAGKKFAREFYKKEFWNRNDIEKLDGAQRVIAFDAVVNHSSKFSKKLIKSAEMGATPDELIEMRVKEYERLAKNPKYAPSFNGWMARMDKMQAIAGGTVLESNTVNSYRDKATKIVNKRDKERLQNVNDFELLDNARTGKAYLDPANKDHKKVLDKHYQQIDNNSINQGINEMNPDSIALATEFVNKYKVIPESLQGTLRGMMNAGNRQEKAFAYDSINEFKDVKAVGFTDKEVENATTYESLVSSGYTPDMALNQIELFNSPDFEKRQSVYKESYKKIDMDAASHLAELYDPMLWFNTPDVTAQASAVYQDIFKTEFLKSGNQEAAIKASDKIIKRRFGLSEITNSNKVMDYPPEQYASHPSLTPDENKKWMKDSFKTYLRSVDESDDLESYDLIATPNTADSVNSGGSPAYYVFDKTKNDFLLSSDGSVKILKFDITNATKKVDKKEAEKTERIDRLRQERTVLSDPQSSKLDKLVVSGKNRAIELYEGARDVKRGIFD